MKKTDLAYFAGIFDGEGCVTIRIRHSKYTLKTGEPQIWKGYGLEVSIANTNEWLCQQLLFSFGGNVYCRRLESAQSQRIWAWQSADKKALSFLEAILPYTKLKRPQLEIAMEYQKRKNQRGKGKLTDGELAVIEAERIMVSKMNNPKQAKHGVRKRERETPQ